jgi:diguanylate cyclase (GGDEF)-like protein
MDIKRLELNSSWKILVVDDDEEDYLLVRSNLSSLERVKLEWAWARTASEGLEYLQANSYDAVLIDYFLGSEDGLRLIQAAVQLGIQTPMILLSGQGTYEMDMEAMQSGATFFLDKNELSPHTTERTIRYAIERKEFERALKLREDKLRLLAELSKGFVEAGLDYHKVLDTIAKRVSETFSDGIIIRVYPPDPAIFEPVASGHPDPAVNAELISLLSQNPQDPLLEELGKTRQARILKRADWSGLPLSVHSPFSSWLDREHILGLLCVPLQLQDHLLGAMILTRTRQKPVFSQEDVEFFQELADRAALCIENARLYVEESEHTRHLQALQAATQALLRTLDFDQLTRKILEAILKAIPQASEATLYLQIPDSTELQLQGIRCVRSEQSFNTFHLQGEIPVSVYLHQVINEGRSLKVDNHPFVSSPHSTEDPVGSFLAVPLVVDSEVYGVLTLTADQPVAFQQQDLNFLEDYSATIIAALHNARLHEQVQRMALTDSLTGLLNRRGFFNFASREFDRSQRVGKPLSVIMLDIDHFKNINDAYGHTFGDEVLQILAQNCMTHVRKVDLLGRFGGDEFIILLPDTRASRAKMIAERIRQCFEESDFVVEGGAVKFTASFGIAQTNHSNQPLNDLISKADTALYASKQKGRNRVEVETHKRTPA